MMRKLINQILKNAFKFSFAKYYAIIFGFLLLGGCSDYFKNDYADNSPTSGKLKVYFDEGLSLHVKNQQLTFEAQYPDASVELFETSENAAIQALYMDSCESIVITRKLNEKELSAFQSKQFNPAFSAVAKTGVALITNHSTNLNFMSYDNVVRLLTEPYFVLDSTGKQQKLKVIFDNKNSSVLHYLADSIIRGKSFSGECMALNNTMEAINFVAQNANTIAFIDFAWLSDSDDKMVKENKKHIKFLAINKLGSDTFELPHQSSFKLATYPFTRTIYVYRKTGEFTLAKGFESFVAGPKGQLTFLKQGLLPNRQSERNIEIKVE
jgi:phosphate transport system substrate-binding protein